MKAEVAIIMGSISDWDVMQEACKVLEQFNISYEKHIVSAHRTPDRMFDYASTARARGIKVIIAGAGGAAHLPGMTAAKTTLPVIGVPVRSSHLQGLDSLLSIVQMPGGIPVATVAINQAKNAALLALQILGITNENIANQLDNYRKEMIEEVVRTDEGLEKFKI